MKKKIVQWSLRGSLMLAVLGVVLVAAVRSSAVQTFLAKAAAELLSIKLGTKVAVDRVQIDFFNQAELRGFYIEDLNGDTLIYAGSLHLRFKAFELFKKNISVSEIELHDAKVHLYRDSTGKHLNLTEVFRNLATAEKTPSDTSTTRPFAWHIDLYKVALYQTDFRYLDDKSHTLINVLVPLCEVKTRKFDLKNNHIALQSIHLDRVDVGVDLLKRIKQADVDTTGEVHFLPKGTALAFDELALTNARFHLTDFNADSILPDRMDFKHLAISGINLYAEQGAVREDTILAAIKMMTAKDRSGFALKNLEADARVSVNDITLKNLAIQTANSRIGNSLSLEYAHFRSFKNFLNEVTITADLQHTQLGLKDLTHFVKGLNPVQHNRFVVSGAINGKISNLRGRNLEVRTGRATVFKGDFSARGLPSLYETSLNLRVSKLATTTDDIRKIYPKIKLPPNLQSLGVINYSGFLDGFVTDFVSNGKLTTAIGSAVTDINFKYDRQRNKSAYSGSLALNSFDLGKFFQDEVNLGKVSLNTKIKGGGLTLESLRVELLGVVSSMTLKGYEYKGIEVNGAVIQKSFKGKLAVRDSNLDMDFEGAVDMRQTIPEFNFQATVRQAHLKSLNLTKANISLSAMVTSNFRGSKIDDLNGDMRLSNVQLRRDSVDAYINYLTMEANFVDGGKKKLKLTSEVADGEMIGNFTVKELPRSLVDFANYTFTRSYDHHYHSDSLPQNFTLDVRLYDPRNLPQIFIPQLKHIEKTRITGEFSSDEHYLHLTAFSPEIQFGNLHFQTLNVDADARNRAVDLTAALAKVFNGDSLMLDTAAFTAKTQADETVKFNMLAADKRGFNYGNITAYLTPLKDRALLRVDTSDVKLANYHWHFNKGNVIQLAGNRITTNNLKFSNGEQTVYISSYLKADTSTSIRLTLDNTSIADFTGIFTSKMRQLSGSVNGKLSVEDVFSTPQVTADLVVDEFKLGDELIGDVNIETNLDNEKKQLDIYASIKSINNYVEAKGYVSVDKDRPGINIAVDGPHLGLNFLNFDFFDKYVKDCRGYAQVNATLYGTLKKPLLKGAVLLVKDTVTVSFLNTTYHLSNQRALLDEHGFNFGDRLEIYDSKNNLIIASGRINHESFKEFALDLSANSYGAQFLNTTEKQSPYFYGVGYGDGNVTFKGPINTPKIDAYARTGPGTWCHLPIKPSYETNRYSFYEFVRKDTALKAAVENPVRLKGVNFTLKLDVTPDARMDIVLDPVAGDMLTSYGSGNLKIGIQPTGGTTIYGTYEIDHGNYLFTLQNIINKRFEISKGGTITFGGEAYKAGLNVDAVYALRSSLTDLLSDLISTGSGNLTSSSENQLAAAAQSRIPIHLLLQLSGILEKPTIAFDIKAIDPDPSIKSYVEQQLTLLKNNESEMNKQVFGLLVMNRFLPPSTTTSGALTNSNYIGGTAANTVSEFFSSQLSNYISNLLDYTSVKNLDVNIRYRQYDQATRPTNSETGQPLLDTRRELQLALEQRLLNNRLIINAGGNLDFGNSTVTDNGNNVQSGAKAVIPTGDFQIEYLLTPKGTWRARAFNRTNYDYYNSRNNNKTGIGISYRRDFDKASELFSRKKKKKNKKQNALPAQVKDKPAEQPEGSPHPPEEKRE